MHQLRLILNAPMDTYPHTVYRAGSLYAAQPFAGENDPAREECLYALRWFWTAASPTRWSDRLLDGWGYTGPDWWGFNATLMDLGASIPEKDSFVAVQFILNLAPALRARLVQKYWRSLAANGLTANAASPDTGRTNLLIEFSDRPDAVALLLDVMGANPLQRNTYHQTSALDQLAARLLRYNGGGGSYTRAGGSMPPLELMQSMALMEEKAGIPSAQRFVPLANKAQEEDPSVGSLRSTMASLSSRD